MNTTIPDNLQTMIFGFAAPFTSGVVCLIIVAVFLQREKDARIAEITRVLGIELLACVMCWMSLICFVMCPGVYRWIEPVFFLAILYAQVFTYRFVFLHTCTGDNERLSRWHYLLPLVPSVLMLACALAFSLEDRLKIRFEQPPIEGDIAPYTLMVYLIPLLFLGYNLYYSICSLRRISRYSRAVADYSADEGRSSQGWLRLLIVIALSSLPLAVIPSVMGPGFFFTSLLTMAGVGAIVLKDVILTYNTITRNYVLILPEYTDTSKEENNTEPAKVKISRAVFDRYIADSKPFLNPELRITDLALAFGTNRTYLSMFINREYGMNFSHYINSLRLDELRRIRRAPKMSELSGLELVERAGFSSYRGYLRFVHKENARLKTHYK